MGAPLKEVTSNGTQIVMILNVRALTPTIITSDDKVINLNKDPVYAFEGSEKYINSGPLLSLDKEQSFDYFLTAPSLLCLTSLNCLSMVVFSILGWLEKYW